MVSSSMKLSGHIILMMFNGTDYFILTECVFSQSHIILICSSYEKYESQDWLDLLQTKCCPGGCLVPPGGDAIIPTSGCLWLRVVLRQSLHQDQDLSEDLFLIFPSSS